MIDTLPNRLTLLAAQVIPSNFQIRGMHTIIRDVTTSTQDFIFYSDRLLRLVRASCQTPV